VSQLRPAPGENPIAVASVPPHSNDAEQALLGAVFLENAVFPDCAQIVAHPGMFYRTAHRHIWAAMTALNEQGSEIDWISVREWLAREHLLEAAGGQDYLVQITQFMAQSAGATQWAEIVRDKAMLRQIIRVAVEVRAEAYDPAARPEDLIEILFGQVRKLSDVVASRQRSNAQAAESVIAQLEQMAATRQIPGMATGHPIFDRGTLGFKGGDLSILAAGTGTGKTHFGWELMEAVEFMGERPGLVECEMHDDELLLRQVAGLKAQHDALDGKPIDGAVDRLRAFAERAREYDRVRTPVRFDLDAILAEIGHLAMVGGCRFIVLDYLQAIEVRGDRSMGEAQRAAQVYGALKAAARRLNVHIMGMSQFTAEANRNRSPYRHSLYDVFGGMAGVQAASFVLHLVRPVAAASYSTETLNIWNALVQILGGIETGETGVSTERTSAGKRIARSLVSLAVRKNRPAGGYTFWAHWFSEQGQLSPVGKEMHSKVTACYDSREAAE
jgi:replicative DNA helicase